MLRIPSLIFCAIKALVKNRPQDQCQKIQRKKIAKELICRQCTRSNCCLRVHGDGVTDWADMGQGVLQ
jgi:hypothetical protein